MNRTTLQRRAPALAMVVALLLVAMMVTRTSQAAFTATTDNSSNSFVAGTVVLTDDDAGVALFAVPTMSPGDTATDCIEVTYAGTITDPQGVVLYGGGYTDVPGADGASAGLSGYLEVTVEEGAAGSTCATWTTGTTVVNGATLAAFNTASSDYATGVGVWTPTSTPETRAYRFTVKLADATPDAEQGASTTGVGFSWEIQS